MNIIRNLSQAALTAVVLSIPALVLASEEAHHGGHHVNWTFVISLLFNFSAFVILLFLILRKPIAAAIAKRSDEIRDSLASADRAREEAESKIAEYGKKIDELAATREDVLNTTRKEAEYERERIIDAARKQALRILSDADRVIEIEIEKAKSRLSVEAAELITAEAEKMLSSSVTKEDEIRLVDDYIGKLEEVKPA